MKVITENNLLTSEREGAKYQAQAGGQRRDASIHDRLIFGLFWVLGLGLSNCRSLILYSRSAINVYRACKLEAS